MKTKLFLQILFWIFPWPIRKWLLTRGLKFELARNTKIGFSIILAHKVILRDGAKIGHLNFCKHIDQIYMDENAKIGNANWISGFSANDKECLKKGHFTHIHERKCELRIGTQSSITNRHYIDCTGGIYIGDYVTIAGFQTAFLSHSIDLQNCRQDAAPIKIGSYAFVSTRCTILKGSILPAHSVLGACSLLNKSHEKEYTLYAGTPAKEIKHLEGCRYFNRKIGYVI